MADIRKMGAEHSVDVDLLPGRPSVIDVGCRGFEFDFELLKIRPGARILAFDPDPEIKRPEDCRIFFFREAVTEKGVPSVVWQGPGDGAYIISDPGDPGFGWGPVANQPSAQVRNVTIGNLVNEFGPYFDLIKLDCEGSEFGILENWPGPICTQISVEFHDFINRRRWDDEYFEKLFAGPLRDYRLALWGLTPIGPNNTLGHWDSLLVRK